MSVLDQKALGGAIIVEPDPMKLNQPYYFNTNFGYQTNGRGRNFSFDTGKGYKNLGFNIGLSHIKIGDRHAPSYSLTNSGKEEKGFNIGFITISVILILSSTTAT